VRELRNLLERASLLCDGAAIEAGHVQQLVAGHSGSRAELAARLASASARCTAN
jgi:DNA-binding NtrC family response regulator